MMIERFRFLMFADLWRNWEVGIVEGASCTGEVKISTVVMVCPLALVVVIVAFDSFPDSEVRFGVTELKLK